MNIRQKNINMDYSENKNLLLDKNMGLVHTISDEKKRTLLILVVEDYVTNQKVVMGHLKNAGYEADLVENGQEAMDAFRKKKYDLILMDIQMPVMGGFEATKAIRDIERGFISGQTPGKEEAKDMIYRGRIPIIAMTAHAIKGYKEICKKEGLDDFISKPLRKIDLLSMVNKWTRKIDVSSLKQEK
jgi:CheY-like chemotaxis protein